MARRKKRYSRRNGYTVPVAIVAGLAPGVANTIGGFQSGGLEGGAVAMSNVYLGYDPSNGSWSWSRMWGGSFPILMGMIVHKVAGKLGVNRAIASSGIPLIRV